jgi:transcriptional regulator with XRE-family HTH domain
MADGRSAQLSDLIRRYRVLEGLSQEQLAERSGLSTRQVSDLERGLRTMPRLETIRMLADGLELGDQDRAELLLAARPGIQAVSERLVTGARSPRTVTPVRTPHPPDADDRTRRRRRSAALLAFG